MHKLFRMIIQIEHNAPEPIYEQLIVEIQEMIESGQLAENDSLPSIRQLPRNWMWPSIPWPGPTRSWKERGS